MSVTIGDGCTLNPMITNVSIKYTFTSDEGFNIDIEIDVAYKWDVILILAGTNSYSTYASLSLQNFA